MGDVTDMMIDGTLCNECGGYIDGETPGYPRLCGTCNAVSRHKSTGSISLKMVDFDQIQAKSRKR